MTDFLDSPLLFPSDDMALSKLSAEPTFKLPDAIQWVDYDFALCQHDHDTATKPCLTDLFSLEPVHEAHDALKQQQHALSRRHADDAVYSGFLQDELKKNACFHEGTTQNKLSMLVVARSLSQSYKSDAFKVVSPSATRDHHAIRSFDGVDDKQKQLRAALRGALDVVEQDMLQHQDSAHPLMHDGYQHHQPSDQPPRAHHYQHDLTIPADDWSWRADLMDVPDLIYSSNTSSAASSFTSLIEDNDDNNDAMAAFDDPPCPVLLESEISHVATLDYYQHNSASSTSSVHNANNPPQAPIDPTNAQLALSSCVQDDPLEFPRKSAKKSIKQWMSKHIKPSSMKKALKSIASRFS
ncbi:hypothetical protein BC940DRAFT_309914 [Gongronella butleri]|nr:hypothetical protein BC940DRAFT_309914 [Gongronella butleri]